MRSVIISVLTLALIFSLAFLNSAYIRGRIDHYEGALELCDGSPEYYGQLFEEFKAEEAFFSLTVSHGELLSVTSAFSELAEAARGDDEGAVKIAKSRLQNAFRHLGQLFDVGIFSIL